MCNSNKNIKEACGLIHHDLMCIRIEIGQVLFIMLVLFYLACQGSRMLSLLPKQHVTITIHNHNIRCSVTTNNIGLQSDCSNDLKTTNEMLHCIPTNSVGGGQVL